MIPGLGRSPGGGHGNSSIPSWKIPWTEEPGRLQSMGSQRVRHDSAHILQVGKLRGCSKNAFLVNSVNIPSLDYVRIMETPSSPPFAIFLFFKLINIFWLCWVFVAVCGLSSCSEQGLFFMEVGGLLTAVTSLFLKEKALGYLSFSSCGLGLSSYGSWNAERRLRSCGAWALVALWDVRLTRIPCISRRILFL